ncbi:MAG: hypothetical protein QXE47_01705 [Candidatus Anstonellales archaeon]
MRAEKYSEILNEIQKELPALIFTIPNIIPSKDGVQVIGELPLEILRATRILHIDVMPYLRRRVLDLNYVTDIDYKIAARKLISLYSITYH